MLRSRIIPCLLVQNGGLVKTTKFKDPKYVGDPINAVKIFNEKEADELIVLDIDASAQNREPDYAMIEHLAYECRMPFCYGGGIKTAQQALKIIKLGVEKVALSSAAIENPALLQEIAQSAGQQSVVAVVDVKRTLLGSYEIYTHNAKRKVKADLLELLAKLQQLGVGEIVVNSIDRDGTMKGYDEALVQKVRNAVDVPITILGGAGSLADLKNMVATYKVIGASAGSLFVFKGPYRAVLINYPRPEEIQEIAGVH